MIDLVIKCLYKIQEFQTLIASVLGSIIVIVYYKNKLTMDKDIIKRELFFRFNEQYSELNDYLIEMSLTEFDTQRAYQIEDGKPLEMIWDELFEDEPTGLPKFLNAAYDYINLCSEEYYWYKKGYVDEEVWSCWHKGMRDWYKGSFFLNNIVKKERKDQASYYNDDFLSLFF